MRPIRPLDWFFQTFQLGGSGRAYELAPVVQPIVDVSIEWPLRLQVYNGDFVAAAGTNIVNLPNSTFAPLDWTTGRARRWFLLGLSSSGFGAGDSMVLFYERNQLAAQRVDISRVVLASGIPAAAATTVWQLIGGNFCWFDQTATQTIAAANRGADPQYVADPDRLVVALTGAGAGDTCTLRGLFMEVPAYQPV